MSGISLQMNVLDFCHTVTGVGFLWFLQSSILVAVGLIAARVLAGGKAAVRSAIYRTSLVAVIVCPVVSFVLSSTGVGRWNVTIPAAFEFFEPTVAETSLPTEPSHPQSAVTPTDQVVAIPFNEAKISASQPSEHRESQTSVQVGVDENSETIIAGSPIAESDLDSTEAVNASLPFTVGEPAETSITYEAPVAVFQIYQFGLMSVIFTTVWIGIASILVLRLFVAYRRTARLRDDAAPATKQDLVVCGELARAMNVPIPLVYRSPFLSSPVLHGILRPAILLPEHADASLTDMFNHELAHLRRRDCFWLLLTRLVTSVFWIQPLLWLLERRLDAASEEVCDDYVVQRGGERGRYATSLVDLAETSHVPAFVGGMGMVSLRSSLGHRVRRIMDTSRSLSTRVGRSVLLMTILTGLIGTAAAGFLGIASKKQPAPGEQTASTTSEGASQAAVAAAEPSNSVPISQSPPATTLVAVKTEPIQDTGDSLTSRVVNQSGRGVADAKIWWFRSRVHDIDPMKPVHVATTDREGQFSFRRPDRGNAEDEPAGWDYAERLIIRAEGYATLRTYPNARQGYVMPPEGPPLTGRIVDIDGRPVVGATIRIRRFEASKRIRDRAELKLLDKQDVEWRGRVGQLLNVIEPVPQRFAYPSAQTDAEGRFQLTEVGGDWLFQLLLEGDNIQSTDILASNGMEENVIVPPGRLSTNKSITVHGNDFLFAAGPSVPVTGTVKDADTGAAVAGAVVRAFFVHGERVNSSRERQHFSTQTDSDGRYRITGLPIGKSNELVAFATGDIPYIPVASYADTSDAEQSLTLDFTFKRGVWAEGRVSDGSTGKPFTGELSYYWFKNEELEKSIPGVRGAFLDGRYFTNAKGEFRVPVLPTRGLLAYRWDGDSFENPRPIDKFPRGLGAEVIGGLDEQMNSYPTRPMYVHPGNYNYVVEVNPTVDDEVVKVEMVLMPSQPVKLRIVGDGQIPDSGYLIYGLNERWGWQSEQGLESVVEDLKPGESRKIFVFHRAARLGGAVVINEETEQPVEISLVKTGRVKGRLLDENGDAITNATISVAYEKLQSKEPYAIWASHPDKRAMPSVIPADEQGHFELDGLIPGWKYSARVNAPRKMQGRMMSMIIGMAFEDLEIKAGESRDLGEVTGVYPKRK